MVGLKNCVVENSVSFNAYFKIFEKLLIINNITINF